MVLEGQTGHLVPFEQDPQTSFPSDPGQFAEDLAFRLTELLGDPAKAKQMGAAGRRRVEEQFSWTAIAQQTIAMYRALIESRR